MAAPTPVSSLVHSSTLVTAGVYVLIRLGSALPTAGRLAVAGAGALTMVLAGLRALGEGDMKKIVALSTLRQLGVIIMAVGVGSPLLALYHLIAHAFFKALLFVGVGNFIHASASYQDLRVMGNFRSALPSTSAVLVVAKASLCGLPFFSGFFSKEAILEGLDSQGRGALGLWALLVLGVILTQLYSLRFVLKVMLGAVGHQPLAGAHDQDFAASAAMALLLVPALRGGLLFSTLTAALLPAVTTPSSSKLPVVGLLGVAALCRVLLYREELRKLPCKDAPFGIWLLPQFSGQSALPLVRYGDPLHKALGLGALDGLLGAWLPPVTRSLGGNLNLRAALATRLLLAVGAALAMLSC